MMNEPAMVFVIDDDQSVRKSLESFVSSRRARARGRRDYAEAVPCCQPTVVQFSRTRPGAPRQKNHSSRKGRLRRCRSIRNGPLSLCQLQA